jgi:hypothetical protein
VTINLSLRHGVADSRVADLLEYGVDRDQLASPQSVRIARPAVDVRWRKPARMMPSFERGHMTATDITDLAARQLDLRYIEDKLWQKQAGILPSSPLSDKS